jgi:hypothetical protein
MRGTLHVLDNTGDTAVAWDTEQEDTVDEAKAKFDEIIQQGYFGVGTTEQGEHEQVKTFEPEKYPKVTLQPPPVAG